MGTKIKELKEGWFYTLDNQFFHAEGVRDYFKGGQPVFPQWESIFTKKVFGKKIYFITVLPEEGPAICMDIRFIVFPKKKTEELNAYYGVELKYFTTPCNFNFDLSSDLSDFSGSNN